MHNVALHMPCAIGAQVVALMCGGDGLADIIGRRFGGGAKLPHNRNKSWAGSAAMFAGAA
jgi:phytol kinase